MNNHTQTSPPSLRSTTAVVAAETARTRRVLFVGWFVFLMLGVAAILASRASAQGPAGAKPPAGKAGAAGNPAVAPAKPKPAPARVKPAPAADKKYDSLPINPNMEQPEALRRMQSAVRRLVTERDLASFSDLKAAQYYIQTYVPAKITQPDATDQISVLVSDLLQSYARAQRSGTPGATEFLKGLYIGMKPVAEGNYPPAARINAILVLGKLDSRPAGGDTPPVPLKYSFPVLLKIYQDVNNSDGVRAAALQGLQRSVVYGFPQLTEDDRKPLVAEMKKLLDEAAPMGRSPRAHAFMQRYAVDILEMIAPANDTTLATKLVSLSTSPEQPELIALYSASRLGAMKTLQGQVPEPNAVLESWSRRALKAFEDELARINGLDRRAPVSDQPPDPDAQIQKKATPMARGSMDGMESYEDQTMGSMEDYGTSMDMGDYGMDDYGMGGMGMGYGMPGMAPPVNPQPPEVIISRRKLNSALEQLQRGVTGMGTTGKPKTPGGLMTAADADQLEKITEWTDTIASVVAAMNVDTLDDRKKYVAELEAQIIVLKALAGVVDEDAVEAAPDATMPVLPIFSDFGGANPDAAVAAPPIN